MRYVSYLRIRTCKYNTNEECFILVNSVISVQVPEDGHVPTGKLNPHVHILQAEGPAPRMPLHVIARALLHLLYGLPRVRGRIRCHGCAGPEDPVVPCHHSPPGPGELVSCRGEIDLRSEIMMHVRTQVAKTIPVGNGRTTVPIARSHAVMFFGIVSLTGWYTGPKSAENLPRLARGSHRELNTLLEG